MGGFMDGIDSQRSTKAEALASAGLRQVACLVWVAELAAQRRPRRWPRQVLIVRHPNHLRFLRSTKAEALASAGPGSPRSCAPCRPRPLNEGRGVGLGRSAGGRSGRTELPLRSTKAEALASAGRRVRHRATHPRLLRSTKAEALASAGLAKLQTFGFGGNTAQRRPRRWPRQVHAATSLGISRGRPAQRRPRRWPRQVPRRRALAAAMVPRRSTKAEALASAGLLYRRAWLPPHVFAQRRPRRWPRQVNTTLSSQVCCGSAAQRRPRRWPRQVPPPRRSDRQTLPNCQGSLRVRVTVPSFSPSRDRSCRGTGGPRRRCRSACRG